MPTVDRVDGLRLVIHPNDHRPAHIHVIGEDREAAFNLHCPHGPAELRENDGLSRAEARRLASALAARIAALCAKWSLIHDQR